VLGKQRLRKHLGKIVEAWGEAASEQRVAICVRRLVAHKVKDRVLLLRLRWWKRKSDSRAQVRAREAEVFKSVVCVCVCVCI